MLGRKREKHYTFVNCFWWHGSNELFLALSYFITYDLLKVEFLAQPKLKDKKPPKQTPSKNHCKTQDEENDFLKNGLEKIFFIVREVLMHKNLFFTLTHNLLTIKKI